MPAKPEKHRAEVSVKPREEAATLSHVLSCAPRPQAKAHKGGRPSNRFVARAEHS